MAWEGSIVISLLLQFRGKRKMAKLAHEPDEFVNEQLLIVRACLFVRRQACLSQRIIPAKPQLAPPVSDFNTGCIVKPDHSKRLPTIFLSRASDFVDNKVFIVFYFDVPSIHTPCNSNGLAAYRFHHPPLLPLQR